MLQFDDNSKRNSDGTPGNVEGDPLRTRRELKKRRLMVSCGNLRGIPFKSKRIQRGSLSETIGNLRKLNNMERNHKEFIRRSRGGP